MGMTISFGIMGPIASSVYEIFERQLGILDHNSAKYLHGLMHLTAVVLGLVGILDMIQVHDDKDVGHWMSLHSWIGISLFSIYCAQLVMGAYMYLISDNLPVKKAFMPYHKGMEKALTMGGLWVIILGELSYKYRGDNNDKEELLWKFMGLFCFCLILSIQFAIYHNGGGSKYTIDQ